MKYRILRNRNDIRHSVQQIIVIMMHWTLVSIMLLQQIKTTDAAKFKGDSCVTKKQPGICKGWDECPVIKTLIESGLYSNREVVSCGFDIKEELICCPVIKTDPDIETSTIGNDDRFSGPTTTTQIPVKDFWMDLLENTTSSTTEAPDFWLDLLTPTTSTSTTTTTTTTIKPLMIGEQRLNESSEFFDFNALLGGKQNGGSKRDLQTNSEHVGPNNKPSNQGFVQVNNNARGNLNTGPVNINQWNFDQNANHNNGRGNNGQHNFRGNGNGNFGWGQQNFNRGLNMGRGPPHNNGRGHMNGRGQQNNGRFRNDFENAMPNQAFIFPENQMRPNNFFGDDDTQNRRPGRPVNNMQEQNPSTQITSNQNNNNNKQFNNDAGNKVDDLIRNIFATSSTGKSNTEPSAVTNQEKPIETNLEDSIANIFNMNKPQNPFANSGQPTAPQISNPQPMVWLTPQDNHEVKYVEIHAPHQQIELVNTPAAGHFEIIPVPERQMNANDLDVAPSTSFVQQPVVIETWSGTPIHRPDFNPAQVVYENLVNSGMDIVKAQELQGEPVFSQQPAQQFGQVVVLQPQPQAQQLSQAQQFVKPPEFIYQQAHSAQNFEQQISQLAKQPLQMESAGKEPRSALPLQRFVQQTNTGSIPNIQSPPNHIMDPFKPFEFRPPPEDENTFFDDNNSLSTSSSPENPNTKTNTDRPAVRACRRIEKGLTASLSPHILGGTPAELGEFPHMAAIGYSRIGGGDSPPYDIRCGGTLIDKRFVLTAAHCVSERENIPSIVRLGVVNFTDPNQMSAAVELRIKETFIHDDYSTRLTYNDIAILELERDVEFNEYIYPVCLYTNDTDPAANVKLWVTGWGTVNTTTRTFSDILLKAPLHISPLKNCNKSFTDYGLNRRIPVGIVRTQICAEDKDQIKDACQGDSGGPLNMILDESYKNYRLVGVVSSGFGCASSTPGLYTRVSAFLDFVEKVVWSKGGD